MASSPTLRRRRLSWRLRELREQAGLTADEVTDRAHQRGAQRWSPSKITRIERNEWIRPKVEDVEMLLDIYEVTDQDDRDACVALAKQARRRGWWVGYSDVLGRGALTGLEVEASVIRTFELAVVPGLLQTEEYARAMIRGGGITDEDEVERRVEARMMRQQILSRADAPRYWATIDEAALRKIPAAALREQVSHLLQVQRSTLRVQVLPDAAGLHAGMMGPFVIMDFPSDPIVVYIEGHTSQTFHEEPEDVERYNLLYTYVQAAALSVDDSTAFLESLLESHP
ncbi:transcriptional regulator with XRE-family HTH domain [Streptomonospora salina]|uniref:Transcriptional regulator with XRE-family HTH domain n=1 Tax=Streptomonospora salina TaxID=104205 RepID=A0A841EB60_9ACTN|nr:helix-turn-helix transcriptional regulator [Streptomonospora salina]MBB5998569.1 transcriptional regulator with XRE-family HTH domain [Streptomonospora salina]